MKSTMRNTEWINNGVQVDRYARVRLAGLEYQPGSNRPDDCGGLYVAPITQIKNGSVTAGQLALFATSNGDHMLLGFITDGQIRFIRSTERESGMDEFMLEVLQSAGWDHPKTDDSYSYLVEDAVRGKSIDELEYI